ncbi:zinc finger protein-like, partial [Tropilaelaps mercedesae]
MSLAENTLEKETDAFCTETPQGDASTSSATTTEGGVYLNVLNADGSLGTLFLDTSQLNIQQKEEGFFEITAALVAASSENNTCRASVREDEQDATDGALTDPSNRVAGTAITTAAMTINDSGPSGVDPSSVRLITSGPGESTSNSTNVSSIMINPSAAVKRNAVHTEASGPTINIRGERDEALVETFRCSICSLEFSSECRLQLHLKSHFREKPHKCDSCEQAFNHEVNLILHRAAVHPTSGRTLSCPICQKRFLRQASLRSHASVHFKDEFFVCNHCEVECDTQEELNYHVQMSHTTPDLSEAGVPRAPRLMRCFTCRKSFADKDEFAAHRLHHQKMKSALRSNRKNGRRGGMKARKDSDGAKENKSKGRVSRAGRPMHECPTCSKAFSKASLLARHSTIHTGEKRYPCKICGRRFTQEVTVRAHMAVHTGERPFECPFCEARFSQKSNLRAHVARLHPMG